MKKFHNRAKVSSTWTKSVINYFNLDSNFPRCVEGPNVNLYGFIGCEDWARKEYCVLKDNVALLLDTEVSFPIFFSNTADRPKDKNMPGKVLNKDIHQTDRDNLSDGYTIKTQIHRNARIASDRQNLTRQAWAFCSFTLMHLELQVYHTQIGGFFWLKLRVEQIIFKML